MEAKETPKNIFTFKDEKPAPFQCEYSCSIRDYHQPLIIDNGNNSLDSLNPFQTDGIFHKAAYNKVRMVHARYMFLYM